MRGTTSRRTAAIQHQHGPVLRCRHELRPHGIAGKLGVFLVALALSSAAVSLPAHAGDVSFKFGAAVGYGWDRLTWNIAGPGGNPNVLSELVFEEIESVVSRLDYQVAGRKWSLDAELTYGTITDGKYRDDDFLLSNRQAMFSRSEGSIDDHDLQGGALMVGYALARTERRVIRLLVGGRVYRQRLRMTNGTQIVPSTGGFAGLNSTYTATWYGPAFGAALDSRIGQSNFAVHLDGTGMAAWYDGEGTWNLRSDFQQNPSFKHDATGWGLTTTGKLSYFLGPAELYAGARFLYFAAYDGDDTTFFSNGNVSTIPLNEVETQSLLGFLGLALNF